MYLANDNYGGGRSGKAGAAPTQEDKAREEEAPLRRAFAGQALWMGGGEWRQPDPAIAASAQEAEAAYVWRRRRFWAAVAVVCVAEALVGV